MPRIELLDDDQIKAVCASAGIPDPVTLMGFVPNSMRIMARRPDILKTFMPLVSTIMMRGKLTQLLRNMIAQVASQAGGCLYCQAHGAHMLESDGSVEKVRDLWNFERSPHFCAAERAALRVAGLAAMVPNGVTDEDFAELRQHYADDEVVEIVAVISVFGFLNRFNDTMATPLEPMPMDAAEKLLASHGWTPGKHGA